MLKLHFKYEKSKNKKKYHSLSFLRTSTISIFLSLLASNKLTIADTIIVITKLIDMVVRE